MLFLDNYRSKIFFSFRCRLPLDSALPEIDGLSAFVLLVGVVGTAFLLFLSTGVEFVFEVTFSSLEGDELADVAEADLRTSVTLLLLSLIIFGPSFTGESLLTSLSLSLSCDVGLEMLFMGEPFELAPLPLRLLGVTAIFDFEPFTAGDLLTCSPSLLSLLSFFFVSSCTSLLTSSIKSFLPSTSFTCFLGELGSVKEGILVDIILVVPAIRPCGTALLIIPPAVSVTVLTVPFGISALLGNAAAAAAAAAAEV